MIKSIKITNHVGESLLLELTDPESSGFYVKTINGLGPPKADIIFTEISTDDGGIDNSARIQTRNITFSLGFLPKNTIEETRHLSYKYFPLKKHVKLEFITDTRECWIEGIVSGNEPTIFSDKEGCAVTIQCGDPFFHSKKTDSKIFYGTEPAFEFPFWNDSDFEEIIDLVQDDSGGFVLDSLPDTVAIQRAIVYNDHKILSREIDYDPNPQLIFGNIVRHTEGNIIYEGDGDVGVVIYIHAIGSATGLSIYNLSDRKVMKLSDKKLHELTGKGIIAGDEIIISTLKGRKRITLLRDGEETNILNVLGRPIEWFELTKGDNIIAYTATSGLENLQFRIDNDVLYEGV